MTLQDIIKYFRKISIDGENAGSQADTAYRLYNNAILLIKVGRFEEARRDLKDAAKRVPGFDDANMLLGLTHLQLGNRIEAIKTINQIVDEAKHTRAMNFYDLLSNESEDSSVGSQDAVGDVAFSAGSGREFAIKDAGDGQYANVIFDLEEESKALENEAAYRGAGKSDFKKRFEMAQKNAEQGRAEMERQGAYTPLRGHAGSQNRAQNTGVHGGQRPQNRENPQSIGSETRILRNDSEKPQAERPDVSPSETLVRTRAPEEPVKTGRAAVREDVIGDDDDAGESAAYESAEKTAKTGKGSKTVLLVLIIVISIALIAALSAAAIKLFHKFKGGKPSSPNPTPAGTSEASTPTAEPDTTPGGETATPEGNDPTETPETATETPAPTATEAPTEAPKTPEQLRAEQKEKLAAAKALYNAGDYVKCYETIISSDWSYLEGSDKTDLSELKGLSLDNLSRQGKTKMYEAVKTENWADVLKYAEIVITYNPDYSEGSAIYFHAAKGAELTGDYAKAERYYNETMTRFPDSKDAKDAKYRLDRMKKR